MNNIKNKSNKILEDKNVINTIIIIKRILLFLKASSLLIINNKIIINIFKKDLKAIIENLSIDLENFKINYIFDLFKLSN